MKNIKNYSEFVNENYNSSEMLNEGLIEWIKSLFKDEDYENSKKALSTFFTKQMSLDEASANDFISKLSQFTIINFAKNLRNKASSITQPAFDSLKQAITNYKAIKDFDFEVVLMTDKINTEGLVDSFGNTTFEKGKFYFIPKKLSGNLLPGHA